MWQVYSAIGAPLQRWLPVLPKNSTNAVTYSCVLPASGNICLVFQGSSAGY